MRSNTPSKLSNFRSAVPSDRRSNSLYSSMRVSKSGFTRMSNQTSVMTPYTNIGGEASRYGGKNKTLKAWYELKGFQPGTRQLGYALNKKELGPNNLPDLYSQFSKQVDEPSSA